MWEEETEEEGEDRHEKGVRVAATPLRQPRRTPHRRGGLAWRGCTAPFDSIQSRRCFICGLQARGSWKALSVG
jgi:hypothetical protein